jgi:hypothetical protein
MKKLLLAAIAIAGLSAAAIPASAAINHGAIAYDFNRGTWGYGYNYGSDWQARNRALTECGWGGCKVYVTFQNACGALATDSRSTSAASAAGTARSRSGAAPAANAGPRALPGRPAGREGLHITGVTAVTDGAALRR